MGVMLIKGYSTLPRSPELKPHHQMQFNDISRKKTFWRGHYLSEWNTVSVFQAPSIGWGCVGYDINFHTVVKIQFRISGKCKVVLWLPLFHPGWLYLFGNYPWFQIDLSQVGLDCRIHRLHLCRGVRSPPNECPAYDSKQTDGEAPVMLELWGMRSTPSLPSLPGPFWPRVVAPDRFLCIYQIKLCDI